MMTKRQWFASNDPGAMLSFLDSHLTFEEPEGEDPLHIPEIRKVRLFACACCRRIERLLTDKRSRTALDVMERYLDRLTTRKQLDRATSAASNACNDLPEHTSEYEAASAVYRALDDIVDDFQDASDVTDETMRAAVADIPEDQQTKVGYHEPVEKAERTAQAQFLREIFGDPFDPVTLDPIWLTRDVQTLAKQMYDKRNFGAMPILADALQDAGCDNADVLNHCRDPKATHVRGCWVLDLLLGK